MRLEDLIGNNVVRTQAIKLGDYMDTSYMHYPVYVKKYDGYTHTAVVTDFNNGYGAILGSEWLDDNWQPAGNIDQYKKPEYDKLYHIIKIGSKGRLDNMQSMVDKSRTITTKAGDPRIFNSAKGPVGKNNDDIDNEIIESLKSKVDDIVNGKDRNGDDDLLSNILMLHKLQLMGVTPEEPVEDSLIELNFPPMDCEDTAMCMELVSACFKPHSNMIGIEIDGDDGELSRMVIRVHDNKITIEDDWDSIYSYSGDRVIIRNKVSNVFYENIKKLVKQGTTVVPDISTIMMADAALGSTTEELLYHMKNLKDGDSIVCASGSDIYTIQVDNKNEKVNFTKANVEFIRVLDNQVANNRNSATYFMIFSDKCAKEFDKLINEMPF